MSRVPLDTFAKPEQICAPIRASDSGSEKYFLFAIRNLARRASSLIGFLSTLQARISNSLPFSLQLVTNGYEILEFVHFSRFYTETIVILVSLGT